MGLAHTMQDLWKTCALLEARWDTLVCLRCQCMPVFGIFCHTVSRKGETQYISVPVTELVIQLFIPLRIRRISFQKWPMRTSATSLSILITVNTYSLLENSATNQHCHADPPVPVGENISTTVLPVVGYLGTLTYLLYGGKSIAKLKQQAHSVEITWLILLEANEGVFTGAVLLADQWQQ